MLFGARRKSQATGRASNERPECAGSLGIARKSFTTALCGLKRRAATSLAARSNGRAHKELPASTMRFGLAERAALSAAACTL